MSDQKDKLTVSSDRGLVASKGSSLAQRALDDLMRLRERHQRTVPTSSEDPLAALREKAQQGDVEAQRNLGYRYSEGRGVPQDDTQAVFWWRKAAEQGHAVGQFNMGWAYSEGRGVPRDDAQAVFWYRKCVFRSNVTDDFGGT